MLPDSKTSSSEWQRINNAEVDIHCWHSSSSHIVQSQGAGSGPCLQGTNSSSPIQPNLSDFIGDWDGDTSSSISVINLVSCLLEIEILFEHVWGWQECQSIEVFPGNLARTLIYIRGKSRIRLSRSVNSFSSSSRRRVQPRIEQCPCHSVNPPQSRSINSRDSSMMVAWGSLDTKCVVEYKRGNPILEMCYGGWTVAAWKD
jgi:hypothetical protein